MTFAPVASLNVFAVDTAVKKTFGKGLVKIEATGATPTADVTGAGITWQLVNDGTASIPGTNTPVAITVTGDVKGKVTIDVNGVSGASITVTSTQAAVTVVNSAKLRSNGTIVIPSVIIKTVANDGKGKEKSAVTLGGNFRLEWDDPDDTDHVSYGTDAAKVGDSIYVGSDAIEYEKPGLIRSRAKKLDMKGTALVPYYLFL